MFPFMHYTLNEFVLAFIWEKKVDTIFLYTF